MWAGKEDNVGVGQDLPHVANGVSVGKIKSGAKTGA